MNKQLKYPYPGLRAFTKEESKIFFGRRAQCVQLLSSLDEHYFVAVTGQSGSGKSSLVKAGVIPFLERGGMPQGGRDWFCIEMTPGNNPFKNLADAFHEKFVFDFNILDDDPDTIQSILESGPFGILELLGKKSCLRVKKLKGQSSRKNLLLLIDQFEEIFTLCEKQGFKTADKFVSLLLETASQSKFSIFVVLTMRSDFLGQCSLFEGLPEAVSKGQFLVPKLNQNQLQSAIIGPQKYFNFKIDPKLIQTILNDYSSLEVNIRRKQDQLPLMQHLLMRLYHFAGSEEIEPAKQGLLSKLHQKIKIFGKNKEEDDRKDETPRQITPELYDSNQIKGISNALNLHADDIYNNLKTEDHKKIAQIIFRRLTRKTLENDYIRERATIHEITLLCLKSKTKNCFVAIKDMDVMKKLVVEVADEFRKLENSFLYPSFDTKNCLEETDVLNITHESLIRCWEKCGEWADKEAEEVNRFREIYKRAEGAKYKGHPYAQGKILKEYREWQENCYHSEEWAQRYLTGEEKEARVFSIVSDFITDSQNKHIFKKGFKWAFSGVLVVAFLIWIFPWFVYKYADIDKNIGNELVKLADEQKQEQTSDAEKNYAQAVISYQNALKVIKVLYPLEFFAIGNVVDAKLEIYESIGNAHSSSRKFQNAIDFYKKKYSEWAIEHREDYLSANLKIKRLILEQCLKYTADTCERISRQLKKEKTQPQTSFYNAIIQELEYIKSRVSEITSLDEQNNDEETQNRVKRRLYTLFGKAYLENGNWEKAQSSYAKAFGIRTSTLESEAQVFYDWGVLFTKLKQFDLAAERFVTAANLKPLDNAPETKREVAKYYIACANALYESQKYDDAVLVYHRAESLDPKNPGIHKGLAFSYRQIKNYPESEYHWLEFMRCARQSRGEEQNIEKRIQDAENEYLNLH